MKTKLKISDLEKTKLIFCLPEDIIIDILVSDSKYISIDNDILENAKKELYRRNESHRVLNEIAKLNNNGIQFEKSGMIEKALLEYEKCMKVMYESIENKIRKDFAWHSVDRLRILYKKEKHPRQKEFLEEFINFCYQHGMNNPETFKKQLEKIK